MGDRGHVELRGVVKRFHAVEALSDINLMIERGTIHALVGENGAGKSTLGKIIGGVIRPDGGEFLVNGRPVHYVSPRNALADGIAVISQELTLVPALSVLQNVFLGVESNRSGVLQEKAMRERYQALLDRSGFQLDRDARVDSLRIAEQKQVEILRAVARDSKLVIMDEPTAALSTEETAKFLEIVRQLRDAGTTIVFVSHFLEEVLSIADNVTVLRNGRLIRTSAASTETPESLVEGMLGRSADLTFPAKEIPPKTAPIRIAVQGLSHGKAVHNVSLEIRAGEIVGLAGLVGSGRSEVARTIFGADRKESGTITLDGQPVELRSPREAISAGIALLPESRKLQGLVLTQSIGHNVTLPHLDSVSHASVLRLKRESRETVKLLQTLDVRPLKPGLAVTDLSGGNQQKVLFAKWLFRRPRVLIVDEPTHGVDVGAKKAIYDLIAALAKEGMAVLLISSELEEIIGLAHRVLVMRLGRIVGELEGAALTKEAVIHRAFASDQPGGETA